jgi:ribonucleoside-diphosphate reductase alpha chain
VTINDSARTPAAARPFEIFVNSKNMAHYAWTVALTRMISAVFRRGGDVSFVAEELKAVFDPGGGAWMEGALYAVAPGGHRRGVERHHDRAGRRRSVMGKGPGIPAAHPAPRLASCPRCGAAALVRKEGCDTCLDCGSFTNAARHQAHGA